MATTDSKYIIKNIIQTYITGTPITKDDGITNALVLNIYERGPEDIKDLFYADGYDVVIFYDEYRGPSIRQIQDVPVHFLMRYAVTAVTVNKYAAGVLVCTASTMQAKARTAIRASIAASAQSAVGVVPSYVLTITNEEGRNSFEAGINIWSCIFTIEYTSGEV